jgi:hypothetical protein
MVWNIKTKPHRIIFHQYLINCFSIMKVFWNYLNKLFSSQKSFTYWLITWTHGCAPFCNLTSAEFSGAPEGEQSKLNQPTPYFAIVAPSSHSRSLILRFRWRRLLVTLANSYRIQLCPFIVPWLSAYNEHTTFRLPAVQSHHKHMFLTN